VRLLDTQRLHGIEFGGGGGRKPDCEQGHAAPDDAYGDEYDGVPGLDPKEEAGDEASEEAILSLSLFAVPQALKQHGGQAAAITCR
jgi:hypothetical protein